jgi:hypothetical protein
MFEALDEGEDTSDASACTCLGIGAFRAVLDGKWGFDEPLCPCRGLQAGRIGRSALNNAVRCELQLHRIWATCLPENPASGRVLEKVGMRKEGFLKSNLKIHGEWKDCFLYAMLREEWESKERNFPLP